MAQIHGGEISTPRDLSTPQKRSKSKTMGLVSVLFYLFGGYESYII
jgi:hypothetical protein